MEVTRQITKHNYLVMDIRDLPRIVKEVSTLMLQPCASSHILFTTIFLLRLEEIAVLMKSL